MADAHFPNPILQEAARKSEERAGLTTHHADLLELYRALFISNILVIAPNILVIAPARRVYWSCTHTLFIRTWKCWVVLRLFAW